MRQMAGILLLICLGCGDSNSPVQPTTNQPTPAEPAPAPQVFLLSGSVSDSASRPLSGASVEVTTGPTAGTRTTTNQAGRFWLPETFSGVVTITAAKDGYLADTRTVPIRPLPLPTPPGGLTLDLSFSLEPDGPSANIAGVYGLTLSPDGACSDLPDDARTRTYTATMALGIPFNLVLRDAERRPDRRVALQSLFRDESSRGLRKYVCSIRGAAERDDLPGRRRRSHGVVQPLWNHGAVCGLFPVLPHRAGLVPRGVLVLRRRRSRC